jgi:hypothetical protein
VPAAHQRRGAEQDNDPQTYRCLLGAHQPASSFSTVSTESPTFLIASLGSVGVTPNFFVQ